MQWISFHKTLKIALVGVLSLFIVGLSLAGERYTQFSNSPTYKIDTWGIDNGLPQSSVNTIIQTRDGFLWLGTYGGLVRFDGVNFKIFNQGNTPSMISDRILSLMEDRTGTIWIGTESGGIMTLHDGIFTVYTTKDGLVSNQVDAIVQDSSGTIWLRSYYGNIMSYHNGNFHYHKTGSENYTWGIHLTINPNGNLHLFSNENHFIIQNGKFVPHPLLPRIPGTATHPPIWDKKGNMWICIGNGKFLCFNNDKLIHEYSIIDRMNVTPSRSIIEDYEGNIWLASDKGAIRFDNANFKLYSSIDGLSANKVISLLQDREGNYWFGTETGGLNRFRRTQFNVIPSFSPSAFNNITSIYQLHNGSLIYGLNCGGFNLVTNNKIFNFFNTTENFNSCVWSVMEDSRHRLWMGTWGGGLYMSYINEDGTIPFPKKEPRVTSSIVVSAYEDRKGRLWFGTIDNGAFEFIDDSVTHFSKETGLSHNEVRAIIQDSRNNVWIGTANGLNRLHDNKITVYTTNEGLKSNSIRTLYEDSSKVLWIGTYGGGLSRLENNNIITFTTENGLFDNLVSHILEDKNGYFWMGCNRGISRVSKQQLNEIARGTRTMVNNVSFGKDHGLENVETNGGFQPNASISKDGIFWFPTVAGVAYVQPNDVRLNTNIIPVHIDYIELDHQKLAPTQSISVGPELHNLAIGYTAPSFIESKKVHFKYKLQGYDDNWVNAQTRREAYYSKIPPGTYKFTVIAANSDGIWNETGASFTLTVIPPYWMTWWFRSIIATLFLSIGPIVYFRRVNSLKRENARQQQFSIQLLSNIENERKRIASELHDSIGQSLLVIKNRSTLALRSTAQPENVIDQLEGISQGVSETLKELRQIAYNLRPFELDRLGLTMALNGMISKVIESSHIDIKTDIDNLKDAFPKENEIVIFRIIQECINNILKHAQATSISITIKHAMNNVSIVVTDNGIGFMLNDLHTTKNGMGITGIDERVRGLGGTVTVHSEINTGTTVHIVLPIEKRPEQQ